MKLLFEGGILITHIINRWSDSIESPENYPIYSGNPSDEIWETKDGYKIKVGDMTTEHIQNCINFIKYRSEYWQTVFELELNKRNTPMK